MNRFYDAETIHTHTACHPIMSNQRSALLACPSTTSHAVHAHSMTASGPPAYYTPKQLLTHTTTAPNQKVKSPPPPPLPHVTTELSPVLQCKKGTKLFPHNFITRVDNCKKIGMGEAMWPEYFTALRQLAVDPPEWWPPPAHTKKKSLKWYCHGTG